MTAIPASKQTDIDPDVLAFVNRTSADSAALAGKEPVSISRRREIAEQVRTPWARGGPDMTATHMVHVGPRGVRARIHIPSAGAQRGTLVYLHGGGWMIFSIDTHDRLMREYAERAGCAVIGLDYSLAPEHRFPTPLDDVDACLDWLAEHGRAYGLNTAQVALGGDSAGANLALCATLRRRDRGQPLPCALLLNYAALDLKPRASWHRYDGDPYMLGAAEMQDFWRGYLGTATTDDPYARPLLADLAGLPAAHLCVAECDILLDENIELRDRLQRAGSDVSCKIYPGATHSFLEAARSSKLADRAIGDAAAWLAKQLGT